MMTRVSHRRRGVARALMVEAERFAFERGRTLLTLDTAADDGAGSPPLRGTQTAAPCEV